jgi:uncharacterized protein
MRRRHWPGVALGCAFLVACTPSAAPEPTSAPAAEVFPTPELRGITKARREVRFQSGAATLVGELDLPIGAGPAPLVVIIHHAGPVPRDAYGYMAELLVRDGFAVFRFDKRGTGGSGGEYGCCEAEDALAAYAAAVSEPGVDADRVLIVAQSIGTRHLAAQFGAFNAVRPPRAVALLSNLLGPDEIGAVAAPTLIVVADSEPELQRIGPQAAEAHAAAVGGETALYVAQGAEHALFSTRDGPLDWGDPSWVRRYHRGAMERLRQWLIAYGEPEP